MFLIILLNALFALVFPLGKCAMQYSPPFFVVALRMIIGGVVLLGYYSVIKRRPLEMRPSLLGPLFLLSVVNIYLANAFEFWGLQYMSSAKTAFIYNLAPLASALISYIHLNETMGFRKWLGLFISFIGCIPMLFTLSPGELPLCHFAYFSTAELAVFISMLATVYGAFILQHIVKRERYNHLLANGISMVIGGCITLANSRAVESWTPSPVTDWLPFFGWLTLIIIVSNIICFSLNAELLKKHTATFMAFSGLSMPLFAALFDWIAFGSVVSWHFYTSMLLVCFGIYIFYKEEISLPELAE
jgi:drug/metabolite transporter (DMT)-like permease